MHTEQLVKQALVTDEDGTPSSLSRIHLGRTKTNGDDQNEIVYLTGRPVEALTRWLETAKIERGSVFRKVDRWGNVSARALEPGAINLIVQKRAQMAGLDTKEFSAHGLRSGYLYGSGQSWHSATRSHGTIPPSLHAAGIRLL